jgi:predicted Rossmann fold nucleotide-binding protein DprA/Smf involved in DNA uptake
MKKLKEDLQSVEKSLKQLLRKTEQMVKELDKLEKAQSPKKSKTVAKAAKKGAAKKPARATATDAVLAIIKKSRSAVDTANLKKKTGFKDANIRAILSRLKKQGKIKSQRQGAYEKA